MPIELYTRTLPLASVPIIWPAIFADDCSGSFVYDKAGTGTDYTAQYDVSVPYVGLKGILLATKVTTPAINDYVQISKQLWTPPAKLLRLQLCFTTAGWDVNGTLQFTLTWFKAAIYHSAEIKLTRTGSVVQYLNSAGTYTTIAALAWQPGLTIWNYLDLAINLDAIKYHSLTLNDSIADLRAISPYSVPGSYTPRLVLSIILMTLEASRLGARLDQILLTPEVP